MIDYDAQLKLQAFLDEELSDREAAEVQAWLAREPEAQALLAELRNTAKALAGHETELRLPESSGFFWSKIEREIRRQEQPSVPAKGFPWMAWLRRPFVPVGTAAFLAISLVVLVAHPWQTGASQYAEMEIASDDMAACTFRDQANKMTVVWFYDRTDDSQFTESSPFVSVDPE